MSTTLDIGGMTIDALRGAARLIRTHLPWRWIGYEKSPHQLSSAICHRPVQ
jgi:hypothetical protein